MAEVLGLLCSAGHTKRAPSSLTYTLIHTMTQEGTVGVHLCNTSVNPAKFRLAVVQNGYAYTDGDTPAVYQFWYYDREVGPAPDNDFDTVVLSLGIGDRIVIYTDQSGLTFCPHGIQV